MCLRKLVWNAVNCYKQLDDLTILALNLCIAHKWQHNLSIIPQTFYVFLRLYQKKTIFNIEKYIYY